MQKTQANGYTEVNLLFADAIAGTKTKGLHCLSAIGGELGRGIVKPSFGVEGVGIVEV